MSDFTANEAKRNFGEMLLQVQREPVRINKNGKDVAVLVSFHDYEQLERMKEEYLKLRLNQSLQEIKEGIVTDGESFFNELLAYSSIDATQKSSVI